MKKKKSIYKMFIKEMEDTGKPKNQNVLFWIGAVIYTFFKLAVGLELALIALIMPFNSLTEFVVCVIGAFYILDQYTFR